MDLDSLLDIVSKKNDVPKRITNFILNIVDITEWKNYTQDEIISKMSDRVMLLKNVIRVFPLYNEIEKESEIEAMAIHHKVPFYVACIVLNSEKKNKTKMTRNESLIFVHKIFHTLNAKIELFLP